MFPDNALNRHQTELSVPAAVHQDRTQPQPATNSGTSFIPNGTGQPRSNPLIESRPTTPVNIKNCLKAPETEGQKQNITSGANATPPPPTVTAQKRQLNSTDDPLQPWKIAQKTSRAVVLPVRNKQLPPTGSVTFKDFPSSEARKTCEKASDQPVCIVQPTVRCNTPPPTHVPENIATPTHVPENIATPAHVPENIATPAHVPENIATPAHVPENIATPAHVPEKDAKTQNKEASQKLRKIMGKGTYGAYYQLNHILYGGASRRGYGSWVSKYVPRLLEWYANESNKSNVTEFLESDLKETPTAKRLAQFIEMFVEEDDLEFVQELCKSKDSGVLQALMIPQDNCNIYAQWKNIHDEWKSKFESSGRITDPRMRTMFLSLREIPAIPVKNSSNLLINID